MGYRLTRTFYREQHTLVAVTGPDPATLTSAADHIAELITTGTDRTRKALIGIFIAESRSVVTVLRVPRTPTGPHAPRATAIAPHATATRNETAP